MCTVTFVPKGDGDYILTSSRDEHRLRKPSLPPARYVFHDNVLWYPKDGQAGGTWIATDRMIHTLCLLNGGLVNHERKTQYRHSRGQVILDFFQYADMQDFVAHYHFQGLAPFTLLVLESRKRLQLHEIIWTGEEHLVFLKNARHNHIWSSVTLYDPKAVEARQGWFYAWNRQHPDPNLTDMMSFHRTGGQGNQHDAILMERDNGIQTVSITGIEKHVQTFEIQYQDILHPQKPNAPWLRC